MHVQQTVPAWTAVSHALEHVPVRLQQMEQQMEELRCVPTC